MEQKDIDIYEILKGMPYGTPLYTPMCGNVEFTSVEEDKEKLGAIWTEDKNNGEYSFDKNGKWMEEGEVLLFPSKEMRDWRKFSWKKGDILAKDSTCVCVFNEWNNDKYTSIKCKYIKYMDAGSYAEDKVYITDDLHLASQEEKDAYISSIEEHYGGKLNQETLEIEHPKQEFKDGDILHCDETDYSVENIFIAKMHGEAIGSYAFLCLHNNKLNIADCDCDESELPAIRLATDSEKQQLFSALEKEGKRWNPDTKKFEDLPKKCEFKPFQKVLAKFDEDYCEWMPDFFYHYDKSDSEMPYVCIANGRAIECIPYNEETKHLLGTTYEWKGGE